MEGDYPEPVIPREDDVAEEEEGVHRFHDAVDEFPQKYEHCSDDATLILRRRSWSHHRTCSSSGNNVSSSSSSGYPCSFLSSGPSHSLKEEDNMDKNKKKFARKLLKRSQEEEEEDIEEISSKGEAAASSDTSAYAFADAENFKDDDELLPAFDSHPNSSSSSLRSFNSSSSRAQKQLIEIASAATTNAETNKARSGSGSGSVIVDSEEEVANHNFVDEEETNRAENLVATTTCAKVDENNESSSGGGFLFILAGFIIKVIGLQLSVLVTFLTIPVKFLYCAYNMFQVSRCCGLGYLKGRLFSAGGIVCDKFLPYFAGELLNDHNNIIWQLGLRFGWGFLWATYVCIVLVSLLASGFLISGVVMWKLVEKPIQMKAALTFDYSKNSPVAFVPIISTCPVEPYGHDLSFKSKNEDPNMGLPRVIPPNHKLQATVSLMLPESDYNINLGIFQVRVDQLSANGRTLRSSKRPCMLHFKSQPIRLVSIFFKMAPLVAGYISESQILKIKLRGFTEGVVPTACLRVTIEQRAEFRPGAGVPEIYDASFTLESDLSLSKKLIWYWKTTLFIWLGLMMFMMQLLLSLICCRSFILPKVRARHSSANNNVASQDNHRAP